MSFLRAEDEVVDVRTVVGIDSSVPFEPVEQGSDWADQVDPDLEVDLGLAEEVRPVEPFVPT